MYNAVVMTAAYRVVNKGEQYAELEDAKQAAKLLPMEAGQMQGVLDDKNVVAWKGGVKSGVKSAAKTTTRRSLKHSV